MIRPTAIVTTIVMTAMLAACSGDDGPDGSGGAGGATAADPAVDGCEHLEGGPFVDVAATADPSDAPDVSTEHSAFRVALAGDASAGFSGWVSYGASAAGELIVYVNADVTMRMEDASGSPLDWEQECISDCTGICDEVANARTVDIATVGTYRLQIESATDSEVTLVIVEGGEHAHE
jgi:hypothetical protein